MDHSQPISFNNTSNSQQNNFNNGPPIMNHGLYNQTLSNQISYLGIKQDANSNNQPQVPLTAPHNNMNNYNSSSSSPAFNRPPLLSPIQPSNVPSHSHTLLTSSQPPQNPLLNRSLQHTPVSYHPSQVNSSQTQQFSQFNANTPPLIPSSQPLANSSPIPPQLIGLPPQKLVQTQQNAYHVSSSAPIGPPVSRQLPTSMSSPYPPIVSQFPPSSTNVPSAYHISPAPPIGPPVIGQVNPTSPSSAYPALSAASIGPPVAGRPPPTSLFNSYSTSTTAPIGAPVASRPPTTSASRASEFSAAPIGPPVAGRPPPTSMMNSYSISAAAPVGPPTAGRPTPTSVPSSYPASSAASIGPPGAGLSTSNYNTGSVSSIGPPIAGRPPPTSVSNYGVPFNDIDKSKTNLPPPPNSSLSGPPIGPLRGIVPGPPMPGVPPMIPSTTPMSSYQNVNGPTSGMSGLPRGPYDNTLSSPPMGLSGPVGPPLGHPSNAASPPSSMPPGTKSSIQSRYPAMQQPINHQAPTLPPMDTSRYPDNRGAHGLTQKMGQMSVTNQGFDQLWGHEMLDLMQCRCIVPEYPEDPPEIRLGQHFDEATNCSPEIFRCTVNKIPETNSLLQKSRLPLGILIHPFKDLDHLPVIQCSTIVRCRVCRTYINPFVYFVDSKRWKCNLCFRVNDLPEEFQYDPVSKSYGDPSRRPEIKSATIEFIAPAEYMLRPPQPAVYLFLLDVSQLARESGYLQVFCETLKNNLDQLPGDARTQVGFICFDEHVHYYLMSDELNRPKEMTILDIDDVFVPMPSQLVANLRERRALLQQLLAELPRRFGASPRAAAASALGPALLAAHKLLTSTGGRITVFQTCLPNIGPGALTPREDPNARSGKEVAHLAPATDFYKRLALDCSSAQVAIDLFLLNSQYADLATLSGMSKFSGGSVQHEPLFASRAGAAGRLSRAFSRYLRRKLGFEAVMRVRCTRGVTIHTFHGNFFVRSTDLLSLPNVSPDAGFGMQLSIEESLSDLQQVCFQAALLYTSSKGERRIRVHTLALPVASNLTEVLHAADQQCIIGLLSKMAVDRAVSASMTEAREALTNVAVEALGAVKLAAHASSSGPLLAPRSLSQLPLLILALLKRPALRTGASTRLDDRVADMCRLKSLPLHQLMRLVYPSLYPIHQLAETTDLPRLQLSSDRLSANGCYLLDDGEVMTIYVCHGVSVEFLKSVFGVQSFAELKEDLKEMPADTLLSDFIDGLNEDRPYPSDVVVIKDNSPSRTLFTERLIQDRTENFLSYYEFLQHVQSQIK